ncbi:MAG: GTP-sensing pleiotropic transcriptional regulator CodY [Clostridiales bacterium]
MKELLKKIRMVNLLIQRNTDLPLSFNELAKVVCKCVESNTYILSNSGKLLGHSMDDSQICDTMTDIVEHGGEFPEKYNEELLLSKETTVNIQRQGICTFYPDIKCHLGNKYSAIIPIIGGGDRLGTLVLSKLSAFYDDDIVLAEYCATVVGIEIMHSKIAEITKIARKKSSVSIATKALSYSEVEALVHIFTELDSGEGIIIASKVATKAGITRSVIVNALRKLESAAVIEVSSLGVKGTHIKIINDYLVEELNELRSKLK